METNYILAVFVADGGIVRPGHSDDEVGPQMGTLDREDHRQTGFLGFVHGGHEEQGQPV